VAELYDEKLFADPPPPEECPICMQILPYDSRQVSFNSCCGKTICNGCIYDMNMSEGKDICAFCRTPPAESMEDTIKRIKKQIEAGNGEACNMLACYCAEGINGMPQDYQKANELLLKGGELGCADAYHNLSVSYEQGRGVAIDKKKALHFYELAAMGGHVVARYNLGYFEGQAGNDQRAMKHYIIAAKAGDKTAFDNIKRVFMECPGLLVTKDEFECILRVYHERQKDMKSDARDRYEEFNKLANTLEQHSII